MEIPEISMISGFEAGMKCLQNPSLISRSYLPFSGGIWKWGAVILAILATFSSIIKRLKLLIIHIRKIKPSSESLLHHLDVDLDLTDDDEDDDETSANSSDDDDEEELDEPTMLFEDFRIKGSGYFARNRWQNANLKLRQCLNRGGDGLTWADFPAGKNVVKLWDSLGLSFGFDSCDEDSDSESVVSLWDLNNDQKISDIFGTHFPTLMAAAPSRSVVLSAAKRNWKNKGDGVVLSAYDTRMRGEVPATYAEWGPDAVAPMKLTTGSVEKVFVRDDSNGVVKIGDMRKLKKPLETLTDTDGVIIEDEFVDCSR